MSEETKPVTRSALMQEANSRLERSGRVLKFFPPSRFQIYDIEAEAPVGPIMSPEMVERWARQNGLVQPVEKVNLSRW